MATVCVTAEYKSGAAKQTNSAHVVIDDVNIAY